MVAAREVPDRNRLAGFEKKATRIAVGLVIGGPVLAFAIIGLGAVEVLPYEFTVIAAIVALLAPIAAALLIGAVGGLYILGGWKLAPFGLLFVGGFAALVFGLAGDQPGWRYLGVAMLAVSGAAFFVGGRRSGRAPAVAGRPWLPVAAIVPGAAITVVGVVFDVWWVLLFGGMAVGCGVGALIGGLRTGRHRDAAE